MNDSLLIFGRTPNLSLAEARIFFPKTEEIFSGIAQIPSDDVMVDGKTIPLRKMLSILGGTVKIAHIKSTVTSITEYDIASMLEAHNTGKEIVFGISCYGCGVSESLRIQVKELLKQKGYRCRYVGEHNVPLDSATIEGNKAFDVVCVKTKDGILVALCTTVQEYSNWSMRDYGRPKRNTRMGMLPPKVARMMINLALGSDARRKTLLDPFCGAGTILTEALVRDIGSVIGTDIDKKAVSDTTVNFRWVKQQVGSSVSARFDVCDAVHIDELLTPGTVHAVVAEPYLGPTSIGLGKISEPEKLKNIMKGLGKLYIGTLKSLHRILAPGSMVVFILPKYIVGNREYFVKNVIDSCENLGYTKVLGPIEYAREHAIVSRHIVVFTCK